ncbi:hypothetical protein O181_040998 [Austropuccinia psidii MF-1]|uniref:Retrovirus-related Pol polyprotein from transposon TNT 1-94-like beta-barrel domain-containing protein n=1 Tax=Austropuccinia psidii MF-1 TaxID=1389203 RepID=A0A9Q3DIB5_9BASI|nr:hypothetical protein [Austropuccinia psidii MF-1]
MSIKTTDAAYNNKEVSTLPFLDGSKFGHWSLKIKIHLRSRELLDVCENRIPEDASTSQENKWAKASYEAINIVTTRVVEKVLREVLNEENFANSYLLWNKTIEQYVSKGAVNRGRIWMEWQRFFFDGDLQNYIDDCRKMTMELESVNIKVPNDLLSFSLLGKLGGDRELHQFVDSLTLKKELIERPDIILTRLQDYASLYKDRNLPSTKNSTALITNINEPHKIVYFCKLGKHNEKCKSHRKEECWAENPHLRPNRKKKRQKFYQESAHLSETQAPITTQENQTNKMDTLIVDCGATNHMFNSIKPFVSSLKPISLIVTTGDAKINLLDKGIGTIEIICNNKKLRLDDFLYIPKLKCNLLTMLEVFKKRISITRNKNKFVLETHNETLICGKINSNLMYVDYKIPTCLLSKTIQQDEVWNERLRHPISKILKLLSLPNKVSSCITCKINKSKKQPFNKHFENAELPLDFLHIELVGPMKPC